MKVLLCHDHISPLPLAVIARCGSVYLIPHSRVKGGREPSMCEPAVFWRKPGLGYLTSRCLRERGGGGDLKCATRLEGGGREGGRRGREASREEGGMGRRGGKSG